MQAVAAETRRTPEIPLLFGEESLKTVCFDSFILKRAQTDAERLFKSFQPAMSSSLRFLRDFCGLTEQTSSIGLFAVTESQCTEDEHDDEDDSKFRNMP